jgi:hypothetical protein
LLRAAGIIDRVFVVEKAPLYGIVNRFRGSRL